MRIEHERSGTSDQNDIRVFVNTTCTRAIISGTNRSHSFKNLSYNKKIRVLKNSNDFTIIQVFDSVNQMITR